MLGVVFEWHRGVSGCLRGSSLRRSSPGRQPQPISATTSLRAVRSEVGGGIVVSTAGEKIGDLVMDGEEVLNLPR